MIRAVAVGVFSLLTFARAAHGQNARTVVRASGEVDGVVVDTAFHPLGDATIAILGTRIRVVTAANGRFRIRDIPIGRYLLTTQRLGYEGVSAALDIGTDTLRLTLTMKPVRALDTVRVASVSLPARLAAFEERRRSGFGQFMTQAEIERRNTPRVTELIRTFRSVDIHEEHDHGGAPPSYYAVSRRSNARTCQMAVVIDNVLLPTPFDLDDLPSPTELAGIELYPGGATIPHVFVRYDRGCGVIMLWTKSG